MHISPYLHFNGQCEEAFQFYERALGGKIEAIFPYEGTPAEANTPAEWKKKIMHARFTVEGQALMGSDPPPGWYRAPQGFAVSLEINNVKKGEQMFQALAEGGQVKMPFAKTFWAEGFGMLVDKFGIPWLVNCETQA